MGVREAFRKARTEKGLSLEGLSRAAGCSFTTVWGIENGKQSPSLEMAQTLARALDMSVDDLFPETEEASA